MNNPAKKLRKAITSKDRVSNLPDEILCHVLSLLNTKQAVATSILSKRWQFLWTYVDTLDLKRFTGWSDYEEKKIQYMQFVRRILKLHRAPLIKLMLSSGLCYEDCYDNDFVSSIQTAISSKNVQTLYLSFYYKGRYKWPLCFFSSETLVHLTLVCADITTMVNSPTQPFFPNLKKLSLDTARIDTDSLHRFISGCSVLEDFTLDNFKYDLKALYISSATLKILRLSWDYLIARKPKIVLNTPALEVFKSRMCRIRMFELLEESSRIRKLELLAESSMPSLHKAHICIHVSKLTKKLVSDSTLRVFSNVSELCLEVKYRGIIRPVILDSDVQFHKLTKLVIRSNRISMDLLGFFMERSNNLRVLTCKKWFRKNTRRKARVIWEEPQHVPKCLLASLELILIKGYIDEDKVELMMMIKYVLGNAKVLKNMKIRKTCFKNDNDEGRLHRLQKILMFPRASPTCKISFN